jgi:hypothetical protein
MISNFKFFDNFFLFNKFSYIINVFFSSFRSHEMGRTANFTAGCSGRDLCSDMLPNYVMLDDVG